MKAEGAFDCAKYSDSEQSLWTNSFQVALAKGIEGKRRGGFSWPLIPGKLKICKGCKVDVNILDIS